MPLLLLLLLLRWPAGDALPRLDEFDTEVHRRFENGRDFGMSRLVRWPALGRHFAAPIGALTDFAPENQQESAILDRWNREGWQVGLFVFGADIRTSKPEEFWHRAIKGPAVITPSTIRHELPQWQEGFSAASEAMARFQAGAPEHLTRLNNWTVVSRPVVASNEKCVSCHNAQTGKSKVKLGDVIGGVAYLYSR